MSFTFLSHSDKAELLNFYRKSWKSRHIYWDSGTDYFERLHFNNDSSLDFCVERDNSGEIIGSIGLIDTSRFSNADAEQCVIWLILFCYADAAPRGSGFFLLRHVLRQRPGRVFETVGATEEVLVYYSALGFVTGYLDHYAWLNPKLKIDARALSSVTNIRPEKSDTYNYRQIAYREVSGDELTELSWEFKPRPFKDVGFLGRWYLENPLHDYRCFTVVDDKRVEAIIIFRVVNVAKLSFLRVCDILGCHPMAIFGLQKICSDWECIGFDLYTNLSKTSFQGCSLRKLVSPEYFAHHISPLVSAEIPIRFATQSAYGSITRGDCDQDRPSVGWSNIGELK